MKTMIRAAAFLAAAANLLTTSPVSPSSAFAATGATVNGGPPAAITSSPAACSDSKYNLFGPRWQSTLRWSYKSSTTPSYLTTSAVVAVLKKGFSNITAEHNDCGRTDHVSATHSYLGTTSHTVGVTKAGQCGSSDGFNTLGFGALPSGYLALTCVRSIGSRIAEIDIRFSNAVHWALSLSGCSNDFMLEAVTTHEVGHSYGLKHVSETSHGRLTMSTYIDGTCENQESLLGDGDMDGLEVLY